jgi:hypothetical protein
MGFSSMRVKISFSITFSCPPEKALEKRFKFQFRGILTGGINWVEGALAPGYGKLPPPSESDISTS